ncbi:helix-turn-helix transcriptional regulator [Pseudonocardia nematodicida]|uniref:Helix-turn-helix transcriptional regulator n=1 Tax=Pseudonocardia nematodicida TaxID=1206997 RepID=A0ABV1KBA3_9PSEU
MTQTQGAGTVGRPERPIEQPDGDLGQFAIDLRQLRDDAGRPTYEAMSRRTGVSRAALAKAATGERLPRWRTVEHYVRDCGGDVEAWRARWEAVRMDGEEMPSAGIDAADAEADGTAPAIAEQRTGGWRGLRLAVGLTIAAVVAVAVGLLLWPSRPSDDASRLPSATEQPIFSEDFEGSQVNLQRWRAPGDPAHLFPQNNVLNMLGSSDAGEVVSVDLVAQDLGTFREVDFVTSVLEAPNPGSGGGSLILTEQSGRTHMILFGVSPGPIPLSIELLACARSSCTQYDDYVPPAPPTEAQQYGFGEVVPVKVMHEGTELRVYVRDIVVARANVPGPLTGFSFDAYARAGEQWHMTVDAVRVYR